MTVDRFCPARGGVTEERIFIDARNNAVIRQKAVFVAHQPIAALTRFQRRHHIGVEHVEEFARIRALDDDLAQGRSIKQTKPFAGLIDLALDRVMYAFAWLLVAIGTAPLADGLKKRAVFFVPTIDRRLADRLEPFVPRLTGDRRQRNRRIGRTEGGGAGLRDRLVQRIRQDCQTVDVAQLALIGRHAQCRVALGMLDAFKPFARGQLHIADLDVVLVIQPGFHPLLDARTLRHQPDRCHWGLFDTLGRRCLAFAHLMSGGLGRRFTRGICICQDTAQIKRAVGRTRRSDKTVSIRTQRWFIHIRLEHREISVPDQLAATMGPQVHHR